MASASPISATEHRIRHRPAERGAVWRESGEIHVSGRPEHLPRRVEDWLKQEARHEIERRAHEKAAELGKKVRRVTIRDPRSRWGSCSPDGALSFSWRLILAPRFVLDYVVAHEVAHLRELNHSNRFWRITETLTADMAKARELAHPARRRAAPLRPADVRGWRGSPLSKGQRAERSATAGA